MALSISGSSAPAPPSPPKAGVRETANLSVSYSRPAVDHVVIYAYSRWRKDKAGDRVTIWRHGPLVRQTTEYIESKRATDPTEQTDYSNVATGASFRGYLNGPGERRGFSIWLPGESTGHYRLVRTDETRTIVGERCTVWRADKLDNFGVSRRACVTGDGVVLYDAFVSSYDGKPHDERTAIKVERRRVAPAEVLPPKEVMSWDFWLTKAKGGEPMQTGTPANYDLRLKETSDYELPHDLRERAGGGWISSEEYTGGKLTGFGLRHSSGMLSVSMRRGTFGVTYNPAPRSTPVPTYMELDRKPQQIVGEECHWFDMAHGSADFESYQCRTDDGLSLARETSGRGAFNTDAIATSLSRGKTPVHELVPPSGLFSWARWGWPELELR